jgi:glycosyltransferase involved in cell wall biosynthesis
MTLGLVMIVKNEAHGIAATLESVKPFVDYWSILDTGSTDGTPDVIRQVMEGVPGALHEGTFGDFSTARNLALDLLGEATTYSLMLDADDVIERGESLTEFFSSPVTDDALLVNRSTGVSWWTPILLRTAAKWRYRGRVHEYVCGPQGQIAGRRVPGLVVHHRRPMQSVTASRTRWLRDADFLREDFDAGVDRARAAFYLAQTFDCLGQMEDALHWYGVRAGLDGWREETFEAMFRKGRCLARLGRWDEALPALLAAFAFSPSRAEPLVEIAEHYRVTDQLDLCYLFARRAAEMPRPVDGLFVEDAAYTWKAHDLVSISAYYIARRFRDPALWATGRAAAKVALRAVPDDPRLQRNCAFYEDALP